MNFNGHATDEEFSRLNAIYRHHIAQTPSWNGIGYHAVGGLENRIYIPRKDVLSTHRAHVSGGELGRVRWNYQLIGFCHMGHYSDSTLPDGTVVAAQDDRPPPLAIKGAQAWFQLVADAVGRPMTLRPHKFYQEKECPGDWASKDSWDSTLYQPTGKPASPVDPAPNRAAMLGLVDDNARDLAEIERLTKAVNARTAAMRQRVEAMQ
jgi:hypothetical protein